MLFKALNLKTGKRLAPAGKYIFGSKAAAWLRKTRGAAVKIEKVDNSTYLTRKWVTGDTDCNADLLLAIAKAGRDMGSVVHIVSGKRSRAQQQHLYNLYKAGKGNLAAKPGTSRHETGKAADAYVNGRPIGTSAKQRAILKDNGLCLPVNGELWHVELLKDRYPR